MTDPDIAGGITRGEVKGKQVLLYQTKSGACVAVEPGASKSIVDIWTVGNAGVTGIPTAQVMRAVNGKVYHLVPTGKRLHAIDAETGQQLWSKEGSDEMPEVIKSRPVVVQNGSTIIVGCDTSLYAIDALTGKKKATFEADAINISNMILETKDFLVVGTGDKLVFFNWNGGPPASPAKGEHVKGEIKGVPTIIKDAQGSPILLTGFSLPDSYVAIDLDTKKEIMYFLPHGGVVRGSGHPSGCRRQGRTPFHRH